MIYEVICYIKCNELPVQNVDNAEAVFGMLDCTDK